LIEDKINESQTEHKKVWFSDDVTYIGYSDKFNIKNLLILNEEGAIMKDKTRNRIRKKPMKDKDFLPKSIMRVIPSTRRPIVKQDFRDDISIRSNRSSKIG